MLKHSATRLSEQEICQLLMSEESLEACADKILKKYHADVLDKDSVEAISQFFWHAGLYAVLINFHVLCLKRELAIPWHILLDSIKLAGAYLDKPAMRMLFQAAELQGNFDELSRCTHFDADYAELSARRKVRRQNLITEKLKFRESILGEVALLESQGLEGEAEKRIQTLLKIFPQDKDLLDRHRRYREKKIWNIVTNKNLEYKTRPLPLQAYAAKDSSELAALAEIEKTMHELLAKENDPSLGGDFAIAHMWWDNLEASLRFLSSDTLTLRQAWLRFELLLLARHHVELLTELVTFERQIVDDAELTFGVAYLRAQALWELGRKKEALEVMEGLTTARPNYRSAARLLSEWKGDF